VSWLLTLLFFLVAIAGAVCRFGPPARHQIPYRDQIAAFGGYALGLLSVWIVAAFVRSVVMVTLARSAGFTDYIFAPYYLFRSELWLLAIPLTGQLLALGGSYTAEAEWRPSLIDGAIWASRFIAISFLLFFPVWWLIQPGKYGKFQGSVAETLVAARADQIFAYQTSSLDTNLRSLLEKRSAIPHAIVIAAFLSGIMLLIARGVKYLIYTQQQDYLHLPPKPKPRPSNERDDFFPFNPRGAGPH
jgi:hypothetical protein